MIKKIKKIILVLLILSALATYLTISGGMARFDAFIYALIYRDSHALFNFYYVLTYLGSEYSLTIIAILALALHKAKGGISKTIAATIIISAAINNLIKIIVMRPRPDIHRLIKITGYSFPSGHSMNNMAFVTAALLLFTKYCKDKTIVFYAWVLGALYVFGIGASRVYLGVHYASDVLCGFLLGLLIAFTIYYIREKLQPKI
ncbi:MAG: phosphatase PAP2 family protein [Clostridiales bacterium]|jgi:undecaprenyl-diphosphatase|nr:phosphatase PAP2 family protein [Clostridiales bacterium]